MPQARLNRISTIGCENNLVTVNATFSPATTLISWSLPISNGIPFTSPILTTTYTVIGNNFGCITTDELIVTVESGIVVSLSSNVILGCESQDVIFTNTTSSTMPFTSCIWDFGDGSVISDCGPLTYAYENSGTYNVSLTTMDTNGCSHTFTAFDYISIESTPIITLSILF